MSLQWYVHRKNHNFAWSRDFAPGVKCKPGETIHFECLDASDGHFKRGSTSADVATLDFARVNPVSGPDLCQGAQPGDALKITFRKFIPSGFGWTANIAGFGPVGGSVSRSSAPPWTYDVQRWRRRFMAERSGAPEAFAGRSASRGRNLATFRRAAARGRRQPRHPRSRGGNARSIFPVEVHGGLFSIGDTHAAQGDGEVCGTAIESQMDVELTLDLVKGANLKSPRFSTPGPVTVILTARATRRRPASGRI